MSMHLVLQGEVEMLVSKILVSKSCFCLLIHLLSTFNIMLPASDSCLLVE